MVIIGTNIIMMLALIGRRDDIEILKEVGEDMEIQIGSTFDVKKEED
jgi:hypothetical protein